MVWPMEKFGNDVHFGMEGKVKDWNDVQRNLTFWCLNSVDEKVS